MSLDADRLYRLLPAVYRIRDGERGEPLKALIALFAREFEALEENVEQLYDDQFIETCAEWVAPYLGDLIGYRPLHGVAQQTASPRAEVANTIAYRRRKGTALMLEQLARDVTDWPARAVEFFEQLATTQYMNHLRPHAQATADLRDLPRLLQRGGAFNALAHTAEMRRPETGAGRYNIPNIGLFLWRLQPFRLSAIPLTPDPDDASGRRFRLDPLGADRRLFRWPRTETSITQLAAPINVPAPLSVRLMALAVRSSDDDDLDDDYGPGESVVFLRPGALPDDPPVPVGVAGVCVCDLRDVLDGGGSVIGWAHEATVPDDIIALDPERGRVVLGADVDPDLLVTWHYGFARAIGGGEYERIPPGADLPVQRSARLSEALQPHLDAIAGGGRLTIEDSRTYAQTPSFAVDGETDPDVAGHEVVVAARNGARPLLAAGGPLELAIGARGRLVLDGLVIGGGALHLAAAADNEPRELVLRHCTLVPGLNLQPDGSASSPGSPSLVIEHPFAVVRIEHCILGAVHAVAQAELEIRDSILDAGAPDTPAYRGAGADDAPGADLTITESTVIGKLHARRLLLASNCIFFARLAAVDAWPGPVWAERRQEGCVRFSYVPADSLVPRRHRCVPDGEQPDALPHFATRRYGEPAYAQLRAATPKSIREGADDEGEMGVMHALHQPQRETNLRIRLDEYLRFGLRAGIFYAT